MRICSGSKRNACCWHMGLDPGPPRPQNHAGGRCPFPFQPTVNPVDPNPAISQPPSRAAGDEETAAQCEGNAADTPTSEPPLPAERAKFQWNYGCLSWGMAILLGFVGPVAIRSRAPLPVFLLLWAVAFFPLLPWLGVLLRSRFPFAQASLISLVMAAVWALAIFCGLAEIAFGSEPIGRWDALANLCGFLALVLLFFLPWLLLARQARRCEQRREDS